MQVETAGAWLPVPLMIQPVGASGHKQIAKYHDPNRSHRGVRFLGYLEDIPDPIYGPKGRTREDRLQVGRIVDFYV